MLKKSLTLITLLCAMVPMAAYAASWSLATRVNTVGGTITSRNTAAAQTSANGTVFKTYTTQANVPVTITANSGYAISAVSVNGVAQALPLTANPVQMGLTAFPGKTAQGVVVSFTAQAVLVPVTIAAAPGGTANPVGTFNVKQGSTATVTFSPNAGNSVTSVTNLPVGAVVKDAATGAVVGLPYAGAVKVSFTVPASSLSLTGNFGVALVASAGAAQTVVVNTPVDLTASAAVYSGGAASYVWTQLDGPATVALSGTNPATFTPTVTGFYSFKVTATNAAGSSSATTTVTVSTTAPAALTTLQTVKNNCINCHTTAGVGVVNGVNVIYQNWSSSQAKVDGNVCWNCHVGANVGGHPGTIGNDCKGCHAVAAPNHNGNVADNNNGVRAITGEFDRWSHHVTGATLNNAHCAACHLEGKAANGSIVIDATYHMADNKIHLRNADDDTDMAWNPESPDFSKMDNFCMSCHDGNGATSTGSQAIQAYINANGVAAAGKTASASNPFGDTISNQYDKMERPAVVDAKGQFDISNPSHHAVSGKRYTGRTRGNGVTARSVETVAFAANSSASLPGKRSTIFDAGKFEGTYMTLSPATGTDASLGDDSTLHCADCHTVGQFAARGSVAFGNLSTNYWNNSGNKYGITRFYKEAIGAHGSANEYLLRNNVGTNARHIAPTYNGGSAAANVTNYAGQLVSIPAKAMLDERGTAPYLVCYNCHVFKTYGSTYNTTTSGHVGEYDQADRCNGPLNTFGYDDTGVARLQGKTTRYAGVTISDAGAADFGNIFGLQCANCHNSGPANGWGGIHGAKVQTYTDGMGNTNKAYRFLPGLGNAMFVPGTRGGFTGGSDAYFYNYSGNRDGVKFKNMTGQTFTQLPVRTIVTGAQPATGSYRYTTGGVSSDLNWEQKTQQSVTGQIDFESKPVGCYTLSPTGELKRSAAVNGTDALAATDGMTGTDGKELFGNWGGCDDHNDAQGYGSHTFTRKVIRKTAY